MGIRVLLLAGVACSAPMYQDWIDIWRNAGLDASFVTYPRHDPGDDPSYITMSQCEEHVELLIKERGRKERPTILVGHSFGGLVAARVAMGNAKVKGLILVAPAPPRGIFIGTAPLLRLLWPPMDYTPALIRGSAMTLKSQDISDLFLNNRPAKDLSGRHHEFQPESGAIIRRLALNTPSVDPADIHCSIHVYTGSDDRLIQPVVQERIAKSYGAKWHVIPNASHMPMFDQSSEHVATMIAKNIHQILSESR